MQGPLPSPASTASSSPPEFVAVFGIEVTSEYGSCVSSRIISVGELQGQLTASAAPGGETRHRYRMGQGIPAATGADSREYAVNDCRGRLECTSSESTAKLQKSPTFLGGQNRFGTIQYLFDMGIDRLLRQYLALPRR